MNDFWDTIVVGAGPAGICAATTLANGGASVLLLDEQSSPGGQIYRSVETVAQSNPDLMAALGPDYGRGLSLVEALRQSAAIYQPRTSVWQIGSDNQVLFSTGSRSQATSAKYIVLATGAMERPVPLAGWTLPGVMTAGALQIMLKTSSIVPSGDFVLAGSGPLMLLLAKQLLDAGVRPVALLETTSFRHYFAAARHMGCAFGKTARGYLKKGALMQVALQASGIPLFRGVRDIAISGNEKAEMIAFTHHGRRRSIAANIVALHQGVVPSQQLARSIQCDFVWDDRQKGFRPALDAWGRSSQETVFVAGDGAGIGGAVTAEHGGRLAALEILHRLGRISMPQRDMAAGPAQQAIAAHLGIRPFLDTLYMPPEEVLIPSDDVIVCRCEEIRAGSVRAAVRDGAQGPNQVKAFLRCGMGPCQGRLCGPTISTVIAQARGEAPAETGYYNIRPPIKPIVLSELVNMEFDV